MGYSGWRTPERDRRAGTHRGGTPGWDKLGWHTLGQWDGTHQDGTAQCQEVFPGMFIIGVYPHGQRGVLCCPPSVLWCHRALTEPLGVSVGRVPTTPRDSSNGDNGKGEICPSRADFGTTGPSCSDLPLESQHPQGHQPLGGTPFSHHLPPKCGRGQRPSICPAGGKSQAVSLPNPEAPAELMAPDFHPALSTRLLGLPRSPLNPPHNCGLLCKQRWGGLCIGVASFGGPGANPGIANAGLRERSPRPSLTPTPPGTGGPLLPAAPTLLSID